MGRNYKELIRAIDALQLAAKLPIATPVEWQPGQEVMIQPCVSAAEAAEKFPQHHVEAVPSGKEYLRFTPVPGAEGDAAAAEGSHK